MTTKKAQLRLAAIIVLGAILLGIKLESNMQLANDLQHVTPQVQYEGSMAR